MAFEFEKEDILDVVELSVLENKINAGLIKHRDNFKHTNVANYTVECKIIDPVTNIFNKVMFIDFKDFIVPGSIQIIKPQVLMIIFELYFYLIVRMINEHVKVKFLVYPPAVFLNSKTLKENNNLRSETIEFIEELIENFEKIEDESISLSTINSAGSLIEMSDMPDIFIMKNDVDEKDLIKKSMGIKDYVRNFRKILQRLKEL